MPPLLFFLLLLPQNRKLHQQFEQYKEQVRQLGAGPAAAVVEPAAVRAEPASSATCSVCSRTKFADGCGRICCYCQGRFCGRCGGRVSQVRSCDVVINSVGCSALQSTALQ